MILSWPTLKQYLKIVTIADEAQISFYKYMKKFFHMFV